MEFFKKQTNYDFMGIRKITGTLTALLWAVSLALLFSKGLNFGLEFTGGTQIEARFTQSVSPNHIRDELENAGLKGIRVQQYGSTQDILIRLANTQKEENNVVKDAKTLLQEKYPGIEILKTEFIGSEVGEQLFEQGGLAVLVSILATMIYIAMRFESRFALSAAMGLIHDGVLILGFFALFQFEFDLATLASILAVLGYSLNDTIVVFDRVRENFRKVRKGTAIEIMNLSVNQTLSRTIMTSVMTMLVVLALLFFGGEALFGFSMAFFIGIIIGTFSSIYVSSALAIWMGISRKDLLPKAKNNIDEEVGQ